MGYYSNYYVQIRSTENFSISEILKSLNEIMNTDITDQAFETEYEGTYGEKENEMFYQPTKDNSNSFDFDLFEEKWYHYEENLQALSKKYPNLKIFVTRVGEYSTDYKEIFITNGVVASKSMEIILPKWEDAEINRMFLDCRPCI